MVVNRISIFLKTLQIKNDGTHNCLDTMGRKSGEAVGLSYCHGLGGNQVRFSYYVTIGTTQVR